MNRKTMLAAFAVSLGALTLGATELSDKIAEKHKITAQGKWYDGGIQTVFDFEGYEAWIVEPPAGVKPAEGHPWTWCMQWATAFVPRTSAPRLVAKYGWRHVTINTFRDKMDERGLAVSRRFQKYLVEELGFAPKANLIGMSWGGFFSIRYAATYPDAVRKIYLDCPLMFLKKNIDCGPWKASSLPDGSWKNDPRMPINLVDRVAAAKIPVLLLYGGADSLLDPNEHARPFVRKFREAGGDLKVVERGLYGHHPHGVEAGENTIVDFFRDAKEKGLKTAFARLEASVAGGERTATFLHVPGGIERPWLKDVPECAVVEFTLRPTAESEIHCRLFLPPPASWNGRFWGIGNTGLGNTLDPAHVSAYHLPLLKQGAATCEADMGTADGRHGREVVRDFGWRSHHLMCVEAKKLLADFYGRAAKKNYFYGVSSGGGQGLHEAQRFPEDYDGIVAYVPAHDRTGLARHGRAQCKAGKRDGKGFMSQVLSGKDAKSEYDMTDAEFESFLRTIGPDVDANSPDLDAFVKRGGKLIVVSGLADELVPSKTARNYCDALAARYGGAEKTAPFFRAYFLPGRGHTRAVSDDGVEDIPTVEMIQSWVERKVGPGPQRGTRKDGQPRTVPYWK